MNTDKKILYTLSIFVFAVLFFALFLPIKNIKLLYAFIIAISAAATYFVLKKRKVLSINKNQVSLLMFLMGIIFILLLYLLGIVFGFYNSTDILSFTSLWQKVLPIIAIIISVELIRSILLQQDSKLATVLSYLIGVIADLVIFTNLNIFYGFEVFMQTFGLIFLPALSSNFLFTYTSKQFGMKPNIIFRLIYSLYAYLFPIVPAIPQVFETIIKFIVPLMIFFFLRALYNKEPKFARHKKGNLFSSMILGITFTFMICVVMLISCQFKYGLIVIGSGSMAGELNVGDAIVYERYENQVINEGDILVFEKDGTTIIHRVIDILRINGQMQYITKGDANETADAGFVTQEEIVGISQFKVLYVGYPSVLLRKIFK